MGVSRTDPCESRPRATPQLATGSAPYLACAWLADSLATMPALLQDTCQVVLFYSFDEAPSVYQSGKSCDSATNTSTIQSSNLFGDDKLYPLMWLVNLSCYRVRDWPSCVFRTS